MFTVLCGECCLELLTTGDAEQPEAVKETEMRVLPATEEMKHEEK
jgi:hypothetical protein